MSQVERALQRRSLLLAREEVWARLRELLKPTRMAVAVRQALQEMGR
jgi:hypothetical protein